MARGSLCRGKKVLVGLAHQFGRPRGVLGALVGRGMARGNAALSRWVVQQAAELRDAPIRRVAELGCGIAPSVNE
jgi:hypothetical protein